LELADIGVTKRESHINDKFSKDKGLFVPGTKTQLHVDKDNTAFSLRD